jgi:class 3 adenylate cyclase/YHS domain-containing protein
MTDTAATFLFADLAGFTALTEAHGDEQAADLVGTFSSDVGSVVGSSGSVVKTIGDAVMVRIPEARDAIRAGLRIASEAGGHGAPAIRVGMHHGRAVERDGDWFGATVNLAARIAALASAGDVLLTMPTLDAAGDLEDVRFARHGSHKLRNVAEPIDVLRAIAVRGELAQLEIDPVCRMAVDPSQAAGRLEYGGRRHLFCSLECAGKFAADPERYLSPA